MSKFLLIFTFIFVAIAPESQAKLEKIFNGQTSIKKPFELRDPFQAPKFKSKAAAKRVERAKGVLDNVPRLDQEVTLDQVEIVGVLIGKKRRVLIKVKGQQGTDPFVLTENDTLGLNGPRIRAIMPGGIILVEKIENIYGEAEFIETVIPISK